MPALDYERLYAEACAEASPADHEVLRLLMEQVRDIFGHAACYGLEEERFDDQAASCF